MKVWEEGREKGFLGEVVWARALRKGLPGEWVKVGKEGRGEGALGKVVWAGALRKGLQFWGEVVWKNGDSKNV